MAKGKKGKRGKRGKKGTNPGDSNSSGSEPSTAGSSQVLQKPLSTPNSKEPSPEVSIDEAELEAEIDAEVQAISDVELADNAVDDVPVSHRTSQDTLDRPEGSIPPSRADSSPEPDDVTAAIIRAVTDDEEVERKNTLVTPDGRVPPSRVDSSPEPDELTEAIIKETSDDEERERVVSSAAGAADAAGATAMATAAGPPVGASSEPESESDADSDSDADADADAESKSIDSFEQVTLPPLKVKLKEDPETVKKLAAIRSKLVFGICVVDFHHIRGPEIEYWFDDETTEGNEKDKIEHFSKVWPQLPFQALPDGAHLFDETFTNFTLVYNDLEQCCPELPVSRVQALDVIPKDAPEDKEHTVPTVDDEMAGVTTLFGCACIRQVDTDKLKEPAADETRSVVQKSVVLITRTPITIQLKEKLGIITKSYFEQYDFNDKTVLKALYDNISFTYNRNGFKVEDDDLYDHTAELKKSADGDSDSGDSGSGGGGAEDNTKIIKESDFYSSLNLRDVVMLLKRKLLTVFKALLLEKRVLVFCRNLNTLSNVQYGLLSLIPNLTMNLEDSGYPLLDKESRELVKPTSLKSSDRGSVLRFIGMPLQVFNRRGFFQPYLTLQQLDSLTNDNTGHFVIGSSNDIILERKQDWFDLVVYIEDDKDEKAKQSSAMDFLWGDNQVTLEILDKDLKEQVALTSSDKRFIDYVVAAVKTNTPVEEESPEPEPSSKTVNTSSDSGSYKGGDDFVRYSFEDYLIGMLSTLKYDRFLKAHENNMETLKYLNLNEHSDEIDDFNTKFVEEYKTTQNYKIFDESTDDELFNFFTPCHTGTGMLREAQERTRQRLKGLFKWGKS